MPGGSDRVGVVGSGERNLKLIREALGVEVSSREGVVVLRGETDTVAVARRVLVRLESAAKERRPLNRREVLNCIADESAVHAASLARPAGEGAEVSIGDTWDGRLDVYVRGRPVKPKSANQERYLSAIRDHDLVFSIGPAGTGKTYLAVAAAVHLLKTDRVRKLILVRPAVEAGEKLGFLPGDLEAKVNPYLRPLFDALHDMMDYGTIRRFMESDVVEVAPLAFMRGRTLNDAVIILDEAQNTTRGQMKMFLTRMGQGSKMVVTGDTTQVDIPDPSDSGLIDAARRLSLTAGVAFVHLDRGDVVRHPMVQRVIDAYGDEPGGV
ncbi:MAG: PhoH family protein [Phycisphaeraceae bacterium]|nr:MAG: PhoH family protein [Phycisphaeraceae bacterium]